MKPERFDIKIENIPGEIKEKPNWIVWKWEKRDSKWTKPPYQINGSKASSDKPSTWTTFEKAYKSYSNGGGWDGIGFMLDDGYAGFDWDDCITGDGVGIIEDEILKHIKMLDSYTEISPSRRGLKTLVKGELPSHGHHGEKIGVFDGTRYFCITGEIITSVSAKIESRQLQINDIVKRYWPNDFKPKKYIKSQIPLSLSDSELIDKAINSNDGGKFKRLWQGDWSGFSSRSEADSSLCFKLAFWTGKNFDQIDSLFRQSGLMRDKWEREDYRQRTINNAIELSHEIYSVQQSLSFSSLFNISPARAFTDESSERNKATQNSNNGATTGDNPQQVQQSATSATIRNNTDVLTHLATHLVKGGMSHLDICKYIEFYGRYCDTPFTKDELKSIIDGSIERVKTREINFTEALRDFVSATFGNFSATSALQGITNRNNPEDKHKVRTILGRLVKEGLIERDSKKDGIYRRIDQECQPMDWINADCEYKDLWLPLGLDRICGVQPGNILLVAGAKDSGKTAFLMNIAKENRYNYKVHYFNSEMGAAEFKMRASKFEEPISLWKDVSVYERSENFADVIKAGEGNLNIIDFLEVVDEFWKVAATIQKIHQKLNGALCVIGLQKNPHVDLGRGGAFSLEKARLYLSLDYQKAKIVSCKNFKENDIIEGSPRGYTCKFTLASGCIIRRQPPGWTNETREGVK